MTSKQTRQLAEADQLLRQLKAHQAQTKRGRPSHLHSCLGLPGQPCSYLTTQTWCGPCQAVMDRTTGKNRTASTRSPIPGQQRAEKIQYAALYR